MALRFLLADDEEDIIEVVQDRLEACGFSVTTAANGLEAMKKFAAGKFDGGAVVERGFERAAKPRFDGLDEGGVDDLGAIRADKQRAGQARFHRDERAIERLGMQPRKLREMRRERLVAIHSLQQ